MNRLLPNNTQTIATAKAATVRATAALLERSPSGHLEAGVQWTSPTPLWSKIDNGQLKAPSLLTFKSDNFMQDLTALLAQTPQDLNQYLAKPESFREDPPANLKLSKVTASQLKLYQPAHGHFNLLAASLVCRKMGLPDKGIEGSEKVGFVLRRLDSNNREMAWVSDSAVGDKLWQPLGHENQLAPLEEVFPMFPLAFCNHEQKRKLWVGFIPTSSQETFKRGNLSPVLGPHDPAVVKERNDLGLPDPRIAEIRNRVVHRISEFKGRTGLVAAQEKEASLFILLDLAEFLEQYKLLDSVLSDTAPAADRPEKDLYDQLNNFNLGSPNILWRSGLKAVWSSRQKIFDGTLLAGELNYNLRTTNLNPETLSANLLKAIGTQKLPDATNLPELPIPKLSGAALYVLRCVYLRPGCPNPQLLSERSEAFAIAPFFDPDAPARPIHITLPADTSISGLRKFRKNVSFAISNQLRKQMESVSDAKKALDGELGKGQEFDLGMICSFSIPIITLCAFIVLMIFLSLLNIVFWWLPFLRICLPIPKAR